MAVLEINTEFGLEGSVWRSGAWARGRRWWGGMAPVYLVDRIQYIGPLRTPIPSLRPVPYVIE